MKQIDNQAERSLIIGIKVEVCVEAAWTVASADSAQLEKITTEAKRRYDQRKGVGQIKRLITVEIKRQNIFSPDALKTIMSRMVVGESL